MNKKIKLRNITSLLMLILLSQVRASTDNTDNNGTAVISKHDDDEDTKQPKENKGARWNLLKGRAYYAMEEQMRQEEDLKTLYNSLGSLELIMLKKGYTVGQVFLLMAAIWIAYEGMNRGNTYLNRSIGYVLDVIYSPESMTYSTDRDSRKLANDIRFKNFVKSGFSYISMYVVMYVLLNIRNK